MSTSLPQQLERAARLSGGRASVFTRDAEWTWAQVRDRVATLAGALQGEGLVTGDRVAILSSNSVDYLALYYAIPWAGGISLPVNARFNAEEIAFLLRDANVRFVVVDAAHYEVATQAVAHADVSTTMVSFDVACPGCIDLAAHSKIAAASPAGDSPATIFYTGGTTGAPKGVPLTHAGLVFASMQWAQTMGIRHDERVLIAIPMFHLAAGLNAIASAVLACDVVIEPHFVPAETLAVIESRRVSKAAFVPAVLDMMISAPEFANADISSLTKVSYGGAPMPLPILERAIEGMPQTAFYQIYGQTESGGVATCLGPEFHVLSGPQSGKQTTAGRPVVGTDLRLCDDKGRDVPQGQPGEVCLRSPALTPGYWNAPEKTAELFFGDWLRTGDVGVQDADGFITIVDRIKDMIISGGENVFAGEVEAAVYLLPAVLECAVIGVPDDKWGERVHAVVRLSPDGELDADTLIQHTREHLADYKAVRTVEFVTDPLPRSPMNKVLKRIVREQSNANSSSKGTE